MDPRITIITKKIAEAKDIETITKLQGKLEALLAHLEKIQPNEKAIELYN
jgi:hypothetical protein